MPTKEEMEKAMAKINAMPDDDPDKADIKMFMTQSYRLVEALNKWFSE